MYWFDAEGVAKIASRQQRVVDASDPAYGGDLQCAVDALTRPGANDMAGGTVYIPPGCTVYVSNPPLIIASGHKHSRHRVQILGGGPASVVTVPDGASFVPGSALVEVRSYLGGTASAGPLASVTDWCLEGFTLDGRGLDGLVGLRLHQARDMIRVRDLWLRDCQEAGVVVDGDSNQNIFDGLVIERCGYGFRFTLAPRWEEYRKDLIFYFEAEEVKRGICEPETLPEARYLACSGTPAEGTNRQACCTCRARLREDHGCQRHPGVPELGCWAPTTLYRCPPGSVLRGSVEEEVAGAKWQIRHGHAAQYGDLDRRQGTKAAGNATTIVNCEIADCAFHGIKLGGGSSTVVANTVVRGCGGHGLTAPSARALRVEGCSFEGNRGTAFPRLVLVGRVLSRTEFADSSAAVGAQVVIGDLAQHAPDAVLPDRTGTWVNWATSLEGCRFVAPEVGGVPAPASIGVYLWLTRRCMVAGCLFQGGAWGVYNSPLATSTVLMGNLYERTEGRVGNPRDDTEDYDVALYG